MIKIGINLQKFLNIFKVVETMVDETDITFHPDEVFIRAIHPSNHCLITFNINKSFFEEYNVKKEITYTLNIQILNRVLAKVKGKEVFIKSEEDRLLISGNNCDFKLNYFVGRRDDRPKPEYSTPSKWKINSSELFDNIQDLIIFSDICKIGGKELTLYTKSNMVDGNIVLKADEIENDGNWCWYDITYIDRIKDIKNVFENIRLGFGREQPLVIKGSDKFIDFEFILAARMEDEK